MEKLRPHYPLTTIKAAFADPARLNRTNVSKQGADDLNMDDQAVVEAIQAITRPDFDKSMTSDQNSAVWQNVYKPSLGGTRLYVKFTLDANDAFLLISFKRA